MVDVFCDYCGTKADLVDSSVIYGKSYGDIYLCPNCGAYVRSEERRVGKECM